MLSMGDKSKIPKAERNLRWKEALAYELVPSQYRDCRICCMLIHFSYTYSPDLLLVHMLPKPKPGRVEF